jgi:hypothetical protein
MGKHFIDHKSSEFCKFFKFFLVRRKLHFFGPKLLPALFLKKPWNPCPFEILEETLGHFDIAGVSCKVTVASSTDDSIPERPWKPGDPRKDREFSIVPGQSWLSRWLSTPSLVSCAPAVCLRSHLHDLCLSISGNLAYALQTDAVPSLLFLCFFVNVCAGSPKCPCTLHILLGKCFQQ